VNARAVIALLASFLAAASPAQESKPASNPAATSRPESQPETWDLRLSHEARAVQVDLSFAAKGKLVIKKESTETTYVVDSKLRTRWLDELGDLEAPPPLIDRRTFLEAQRTESGLVQDPGLEGVSLVITSKNSDAKLAAEGSRRALTATLDKQLRQRGSTGLYVACPDGVRIGSTWDFTNASLLYTLLDLDGTITTPVKSEFTLVAVDRPTSRATISTTVGFTEEVDKNRAQFAAEYRGTLTAEIDLKLRSVAKAAFIGRAKLSGRGQFEGVLSGEVDVDGKATGTPVADPKALKSRKPVFRENTHHFAGMELKLPSCWLKLDQKKPGLMSFVDSRVESDLVIELARVDQQTDPATDEFVKALLADLRKEDQRAKVTKTSYPAGKGAAFELVNEGGSAIRGAVVPIGDDLGRVRLVGQPAAVKKAEAEFKAALNTLKKAKP
jgi:hypothetical protein